jgi:UDPglucose--hexose-1-phosphate uridylyltransferase
LFTPSDPAAGAPAGAVPTLFGVSPSRGAHEVLRAQSGPGASLADLAPGELAAAVDHWRERMRAHGDAELVHVQVDETPRDGGRAASSTTQLLALDFVPALVARERERFTAHQTRTMGGNLLQDLVQEEVRQRTRLVAVDDEAVLLVAFAGRGAHQLLLAPRVPRARFEDDGPTGAALLGRALRRLRSVLGAETPMRLWVRTAPRGADIFCWHIDIVPGAPLDPTLEMATGLHIADLTPEVAAEALRGADG